MANKDVTCGGGGGGGGGFQSPETSIEEEGFNCSTGPKTLHERSYLDDLIGEPFTCGGNPSYGEGRRSREVLKI